MQTGLLARYRTHPETEFQTPTIIYTIIFRESRISVVSATPYAKLGLAGAFFGIAAAVLHTSQMPTTGVEMSIYLSNPVFWLLLIIASVISVPIILSSDDLWPLSGVALGTIAFVAAAFPVLHGYYYFGPGDALSHLGTVRTLDRGALPLQARLYWASHVISLFLHNMFDISIRRATMFVSPVFVLTFLVSLPVLMRRLSMSQFAPRVGVIIASSLLIVDSYSTHIDFHPFSQTTLLIPFVLLVVLLKLRTSRAWFKMSVISCVLVFHPAHLILILGGLGSLYLAERLLNTNYALTSLTAIVPIGIVLWLQLNHRRHFEDLLAYAAVQVSKLAGAGSWVSSQTESASTAGVGIVETFIVLFGPSLLLSTIGGISILIWLVWYLRGCRNSILNRRIGLAAFFLPIAGLFGVTIAIQMGDFAYRIIGVLVVGASIFAAAGITDVLERFEGLRIVSIATIILLCALLVAGLSTVHMSPHIISSNYQVTESSSEGYSHMIKYENENSEYLSIGTPAYRWRYAIEGTDSYNRLYNENPPDHFSNQSLEAKNRTVYLMVTSKGKQASLDVYNGFRYNNSDFEYLETGKDTGVIYSSGSEGTRIYFVYDDEN